MEAVKYRNEIKYICTNQMLALIEGRIRHVCSLDRNVGDAGIYTIQSAYFDDYRDSGYYDNEDGCDPREKFRIRIYNGDLGRIALECKQKNRGMIHKESCLISRELCAAFFQDKKSVIQDAFCGEEASGKALLKKFILQYQTVFLRPKVVIRYDRTPYVYAAGNVRITFDRNIEASAAVNDLAGEKIFRPVMQTGYHVLEVKYDELLPDFLYNLLQIPQLQRTNYSKYYIGRRLLDNEGK